VIVPLSKRVKLAKSSVLLVGNGGAARGAAFALVDAGARLSITGRNPDAIAYDSVSNRVFTFNGATANASVIDASTLQQVGTIDLGGKPEMGVPDGNGMIYVNIEDKGEVVALDTRAMQVKARYSLAPCEEPTGMARDKVRGRLIVGCGNSTMAIMDEKTGKRKNLGTFDSRAAAEKHERAVQFFKRGG